jgi:glycosyltransferase involved in cell wall biosynthesis
MKGTVLHINLSRTWRGGEAQTLLLAEGMHARGVRCQVAARPGSPLADRCTAAGLDVVALDPRGELDPVAALRLRRHIRREKVRIVHAHTAHAHGTAALALAGLKSIPLVVTRRVQRGIAPGRLSRAKYRACARIIAISDHIRTLLIEAGLPPERIVRIHSGIDPEKFTNRADRAGIRRECGFPEQSVVVGTVAALTREKGLPVLIEAAATVAHRCPHARFLVVGDGPLSDELQTLRDRLDLGERMRFTGFRTDVGALLSAMDIFAFPSLSEGLGTSILDAMLMGLPVVATRTGGIPELVHEGDTGYLFPPGDHESLARRLVELACDEGERHRLGHSGARRVRAFSVARTIEATIAVYDDVLRERNEEKR